MTASRLNPAGNAALLAGLVWLALGAFVAVQGHETGIGTVRDPGGGFLLFWIGLLMVGFSLAIVTDAVRSGGPALPALWRDVRWGKVLVVVAALIAYAFVFEALGFILATVPLLLILLRAVDPVRWTVAVPLALGATLGVWFVIKRLLLIQLPSGAFAVG